MKKAIIATFILLSSLFLLNPITTLGFAQNKISSQIYHNELTNEQAQELLIKHNNQVDYIFQGDASEFKVLKEKNLHGYVFLPDVDTDIGYFVDKNNSNIYYFHPSGYLELVK